MNKELIISKEDFKVELLNPEEIKDFVRRHGETAAVCYNTNPKFAMNVGKSVLKTGHFSGSRGDYFKFKISFVPRACYDSKTEILTKNGWKFFKDIKDDEIVATLNDETQTVEFHPINEKISYLYNGVMHDINSKSVSLSITDNHNIYYKKHDVRVNKDETYLSPIGEINFDKLKMNKNFKYINNVSDKIEIQGYEYNKKTNNGGYCTMKTKDLVLNKKIFFKLLAWYLSDGSTYYDKKENKYVISICQTNCEANSMNNTREVIYNIIKELGFTPVYDKNSIKFNSMTLGRFLKSLGLCNEKYIPFNIYDEFNKEYAQIFLNEYFKGDGHIDKNGCGKFYTTSKKLADQLQELCFLAGWTAMIYTRGEELLGKKQIICGREVTVNHIGYVVNVTFNSCENVYCVNVKNNIIFVRQNGKAVWCGNCVDQSVRHDVGTFKNVQSQRYVNQEEFKMYYPKEILDDQYLLNLWMNHQIETQKVYKNTIDRLAEKGITGEKASEIARGMSPMNIESTYVQGFTLEALMNFMNKRLCSCSQEHIRYLAKLMRDEVLKVAPIYEEYLVPICERQLWCPEDKKRCCGRKPVKEDLIKILNK